MKSIQGLLAVLAFAAVAICGCETSQVSENWGNAHRANVEQMTLNPSAGQAGAAVEMDPETAEMVMEGYRSSQEPHAQSPGRWVQERPPRRSTHQRFRSPIWSPSNL